MCGGVAGNEWGAYGLQTYNHRGLRTCVPQFINLRYRTLQIHARRRLQTCPTGGCKPGLPLGVCYGKGVLYRIRLFQLRAEGLLGAGDRGALVGVVLQIMLHEQGAQVGDDVRVFAAFR